MSEYSEALVEKVATALWDTDYPNNSTARGGWDNTHLVNRDYYMIQARATLEALGLREIRAEAWDEGHAAADDFMARFYSTQHEGIDCDCDEPPVNPYREGK